MKNLFVELESKHGGKKRESYSSGKLPSNQGRRWLSKRMDICQWESMEREYIYDMDNMIMCKWI